MPEILRILMQFNITRSINEINFMKNTNIIWHFYKYGNTQLKLTLIRIRFSAHIHSTCKMILIRFRMTHNLYDNLYMSFFLRYRKKAIDNFSVKWYFRLFFSWLSQCKTIFHHLNTLDGWLAWQSLELCLYIFFNSSE